MQAMDKMKRKFQGVWIPAELWLSKELTLQEKILISEISCFKEYWKTNAAIAEFLGISKDRTSRIISSLVKKGILINQVIRDEKTKQIVKRILTIQADVLDEILSQTETELPIEEPIENMVISPIPYRQKYQYPIGENTNTLSVKTPKGVIQVSNTVENTKDILSCKHDEAPTEVVEADIVESAAKPKQAIVGQVEEIVDYLNAKLGTSYKATTKDTVSRIKARLKEGFTVADFKTVIDKKADEWSGDEKMVKYLRPSTLFGSNFESYLNQMDVDYSKATPTVSERDKRERANTMQLLKEAREYDSRNGNTVPGDIAGKLPW